MALNFLNNGYFAGKVGIGTESPGEKLSVYDSSSSTGYVASFGNSSNLELLIGTTTGAYLNIQGSTISSGAPYNITLQNDGGNVGIGTTAPTSKLHIEGSSDGTGAGVDAMLHVKQTGSWNANEPWALYVDGYSYLNGFRINANDGIRGLFKTQSGGSLGFATAGADPITFTQSNSAEKMRIHSNGNVGIGTTAPVKTLDVAANGASQGIHLNISGVGRLQMYADGNRNYFKGLSGNGHRFTTTGGANVEILNNGNVGIGTTAPAAQLQVKQLGINVNQSSVASTNQYTCDSMSATIFRSARYTIQITNTTDSTYHLTEMLLIHDGTTPSINEFGTIFTGSAAEAVFTADINSGNVRLLATPASSDAMQFKVVRHSILV